MGRVLLCSLLQNDRSVFAYLALALELFALFPLWCRHVATFAPELHYRCAALLVALATALLVDVKRQVHGVLLLALGAPLALYPVVGRHPLQALLLGGDGGVNFHPAAAGALVALVALGLRVAVVARDAVALEVQVAICDMQAHGAESEASAGRSTGAQRRSE